MNLIRWLKCNPEQKICVHSPKSPAVRSEHCAEHCAEHCGRGITPPGRTSLRPISCPRTSSRASMRCPCVFCGITWRRSDLIESSTDARSSTFRACIHSTAKGSRSCERPSARLVRVRVIIDRTARVSTFRGHALRVKLIPPNFF